MAADKPATRKEASTSKPSVTVREPVPVPITVVDAVANSSIISSSLHVVLVANQLVRGPSGESLDDFVIAARLRLSLSAALTLRDILDRGIATLQPPPKGTVAN